MKILRVKKTKLFDVFIGSGWKNHSRVLVNEVGHIFHKEGKKLSKIQYIEISKTIGGVK
jgi:hypothetical protein